MPVVAVGTVIFKVVMEVLVVVVMEHPYLERLHQLPPETRILVVVEGPEGKVITAQQLAAPAL
jgi:hypothetical protein